MEYTQYNYRNTLGVKTVTFHLINVITLIKLYIETTATLTSLHSQLQKSLVPLMFPSSLSSSISTNCNEIRTN